MSHPATVALRALAHEAVVTEDGPHPLAELGTIAARCKRRRSHGPCHPRATSSGNHRYAAVNGGHPRGLLCWTLGTDLTAATARQCMACKRKADAEAQVLKGTGQR